jgi:hypothetical protein
METAGVALEPAKQHPAKTGDHTSIARLAFTSGDCASALASSAHATTSTISMIAPTSLRKRMGMASLNCGIAGTTIWSASPPATQ